MTATHPADAGFQHGDEDQTAAAAPPPPPAAAAPAAPQAPRPAPAGSRIAAVTVEDKVEFLSGRRVKMTVNGDRFDLRAPTHQEYKRYRLAFNQLAADGRAQTLAGEPIDQADDVYEMIISVINEFSAQPWTIDPAAEPPWLESAQLMRNFLSHWAEVPGSPG